MTLRVNFAGVEDKDFEALPSGTYRCSVANGEVAVGKDSGQEYIKWTFIVQEGKYTNRNLWSNTTLQQKGLFNLKKLLKATGRFTDDDLAGDIDFEIDDVIGAQLMLVVGQQEYQDRITNQVRNFKPVSDEDVDSVLP
jgi:hypothetical protein